MRVAVVGGGIAGLTAAYRVRTLLGNGARITVFDAAERLGGKLFTTEVGALGVDVGAEAFLVRRPEASALADELGLGSEVVSPTQARATIRAGGRTVPLPTGTMMGIPADPLAVAGLLSADGLRAVAGEESLGPIDLPPEDVSLGRLLRARFGDELVDRVVDPLLNGVYGGGADGLGLRAVLPSVAAAVDDGAPSLTAAAKSALSAAVDGPVFGTIRGGLSAMIDRLTALSGAEIRTGAPVRDLRRTASEWTIADEPFDGVVLAVPAPSARRLLDAVSPEAAKAYGEVELASTTVVTLVLPGDSALPEASGVLIAEGETHADGTPFTAKAFTFSSRKWAHYADRGVVLRGSVGRFGDIAALSATDDELVRLVLADLAELTGGAVTPAAVRVQRWGGGLPQYGVGHTALVARIEQAVAELPALEVAGATLHGVGIPACIATGNAAARGLVGSLAVGD